MAHEVETIAYKGLMPWHGLGTRFEGDLTPAQMLDTAKLDWGVSKRPMWTADSNATQPKGLIAVEKNFALVRDTDNYVLGVCGPDYIPFQNAEVMDFFRKFTDAGHMSLEVAGSLRRGRIIWGLAKLDEGKFKMDGDTIESYLLLVSPHMWGKSLDIMFTPVRVVCMNTLQLALGKKMTDRFRAVHNRPFSDIKSAAEFTVEQVLTANTKFRENAELLAGTQVKDVQKLYRYYAQLFQPTLLAADPINPGEFSRKSDRILTLYHNGPGAKLDTARGTWWGAVNAVTHYFDHVAGISGDRDPALTNAWFGMNALHKRKALDLAVEYAKAA
jgi:phage/plasmid-like protein (TIGR03299 family)